MTKEEANAILANAQAHGGGTLQTNPILYEAAVVSRGGVQPTSGGQPIPPPAGYSGPTPTAPTPSERTPSGRGVSTGGREGSAGSTTPPPPPPPPTPPQIPTNPVTPNAPSYPTQPNYYSDTSPKTGTGTVGPTNELVGDYGSTYSYAGRENKGGGGITTAEPLQMAEQNRIRAASWGDTMDKELQSNAQRYMDREGRYMDQLLTGPGGYQDILAGQGGFNPQQQSNLLQENLLRQGMVTPQQLQDQYLRDYEYQQIMGQPWHARDFASGQVDRLNWLQEGDVNRQWQEANYAENLYNQAIDPNQLGVRQDYYPEMQGLITNAGEGYSNILNPDYLTVRPEYFDAGNQTLDNLSMGYGDIIDPRRLGLSEEYVRDYQFGPQDMQAYVDQAGRTVGLRGQAERDAMERAAAAAGNTSPLALAAASSRNKVLSDISAGDVMNDARIRAKQLQMDTTANREGMRLGAERDITGRATSALENLAAAELGQLNQSEAMRLGAEQGLADRSMSAWSETTGRALNAANDYELMRQNAQRDISNRQLQKAQDIGSARMGTAESVAGQHQQLGQYGTGMLTDLTRYGDEETSRRAQDLAQNRQDVGYQNINTLWGQYAPASTMLSDRYAGIYGQQKSEEKEGRGFLQGQQAAGQEGLLTSEQQRLQAGGTQLQGLNQGTDLAIQAKYIPKWYDKLLAAI